MTRRHITSRSATAVCLVTLAGLAQAQTLLPATQPSYATLTYTSNWYENFDNKTECSFFSCSGTPDWQINWAVAAWNGAGLDVTVVNPPTALIDSNSTTTPQKVLRLQATNVQEMNPQLKIPVAMQHNKRYRLSANVLTSSAVKLRFAIQSSTGVPLNGRTLDIPASSSKQPISIDFVHRFADKGDTTKPILMILPATNGSDVYLDNLKLEEVTGMNPVNMASDKSIGKVVPSTSEINFDPRLLGFTNTDWAPTNPPVMGQKVQRMWDNGLYWGAFENTQYDYNTSTISRMDTILGYAAGQSVDVIWTFGLSPAWAIGGATCTGKYASAPLATQGCFEPPVGTGKTSAWPLLVRNFSALRSAIKYYELWNESDYMFNGTGAELASLANLARTELNATETAKGWAPRTFKLIGPTPTPLGMRMLDDFLRAGGGSDIDIVGYHSYYTPYDLENILAADVANVKLVMDKNGINKPIWNTEGAPWCDASVAGCTSVSPTTAEVKGLHVRALAMMWANGVSNFDYYTLKGGTPIPDWARLVLPGTTTPPALADAGAGFKTASDWFTGMKMTSAYKLASPSVYIFHLSNIATGAKSYLIWTTQSTSASVQVPMTWLVSQYKSTSSPSSFTPLNTTTRALTLTPYVPVMLVP